VTAAPVATPAPVVTAAPTQVVVATIPADQLVVTGHLTICSDIPYPPQEYFDKDGNPTGSDIDIGNEIANRVGLKMAVQNTVFDTIIAPSSEASATSSSPPRTSMPIGSSRST
jgi:Bacterial extracellular solute-binding proteins, family 3.